MILRAIFALILPPVSVFMGVGATKHFWINLVLTLLAGFPGMVHAVWVMAAKPTP